MIVKRKIRYNVQDDFGEQVRLRHRWIFCVINRSDEIVKIKQKILRQMVPADDLVENYNYSLPRSNGLQGVIFSFSSDVGLIRDKKLIYNSKDFRCDRNLLVKKGFSLEDYIRRISYS